MALLCAVVCCCMLSYAVACCCMPAVVGGARSERGSVAGLWRLGPSGLCSLFRGFLVISICGLESVVWIGLR